MAALSLSDIMDLRTYEREREEFRRSLIELKRFRRVELGELISLVFENRETIRFQIQEMARAEKMMRDDQIQAELNIYNPLIPDRGEVKATLFLELTTEELLREWLPALVGIERSLYLEIGQGQHATRIMSSTESDHEAQLTREDMTSSVHYIEWSLETSLQEKFGSEKIFLGVDHPKYQAKIELSPETVDSLRSDWVV